MAPRCFRRDQQGQSPGCVRHVQVSRSYVLVDLRGRYLSRLAAESFHRKAATVGRQVRADVVSNVLLYAKGPHRVVVEQCVGGSDDCSKRLWAYYQIRSNDEDLLSIVWCDHAVKVGCCHPTGTWNTDGSRIDAQDAIFISRLGDQVDLER